MSLSIEGQPILSVPRQREYLKKFLLAHCVDHRPGQPLRKLKSGGESDTYVDVRVAAGHPRALEYICNAFRAELPPDTWQIAGVAEGGLPPYGGVLIGLGDNYRGCWVPKGTKAYGTGKAVQGILLPGADAILLEDTISEGSTSLENKKILETVDINVVGVMCVVERDEIGGRKKLEAAGLWVKSQFRMSELVPTVVYLPPPLAA